MRNILALIDNSVYAKSVCDYAAWLSARTGATINLLHVVSPRDISARRVSMSGALSIGAGPGILHEVARVTREELEQAEDVGHRLLEAHRTELVANGAIAVQARLLVGDLSEIAREAEAEADVIVVGKRGEAADFANLRLGRNFERVLWGTRKPVLISPRTFRPVSSWMVAFGTSAGLREGIEKVSSGDLLPPLPCHLVHVGEPDRDTRNRVQYAATLLSDAGFPVTAHVVPGDPEQVIPERVIADDTGLVALGGFTRWRLRDAFFGALGTASTLIRSCQTPLLLLR